MDIGDIVSTINRSKHAGMSKTKQKRSKVIDYGLFPFSRGTEKGELLSSLTKTQYKEATPT